jgi:hypothetical protein
MLTSTLGAVLFTVLVVGGLTVPALRRLGVECDVAVDRRDKGDVSRSPNPKRTTRQSGKTYDERADATAVLVRSNADDGPAAKRGGGRRDRSEGGKTFGSFDDAEGGGTYGIDVRETFRFVDRQYITPMFTLEENSRDAGNGDGNGNGGDGADSR